MMRCGVESWCTVPELALSKAGDNMGIRTNAVDFDTAVTLFAEALWQLVSRGCFAGDWQYQFWLWGDSFHYLMSHLELSLMNAHERTAARERLAKRGHFKVQPDDYVREWADRLSNIVEGWYDRPERTPGSREAIFKQWVKDFFVVIGPDPAYSNPRVLRQITLEDGFAMTPAWHLRHEMVVVSPCRSVVLVEAEC